tara:strand:+ start:2849 stop:3361 length:513 start_codon:yes stop_codon:yes gene_type:complete
MIFLGIGSNLSSSYGDRFQNISLAIKKIEELHIIIHKKSSCYETYSFPNKNDPKFINIIVAVKTTLSPHDLMQKLILIEEKLERKRNKKNDPRTCDIDIIDFNGQILNFEYKNLILNIPHAGLTKRSFVLYPLKEINPKWKHPKTGESIDELINNLPDFEKKSILKLNDN